MAKRIYRYDLGERVLIRRKTLGSDKEGKGTFVKTSVIGTYNPHEFIIAERSLKHTRDTFLTPVYKVATLDQNFYESDLKKVTYNDTDDTRDNDDKR